MQRFAALLFSLFAASALAKEVSLFANEQAGTIVSSPDGEFTECRGPAQPSQGRTVEVVRHFASLRHSTCEWIAVTGRHDLDGPIMYYRNGVDVVCVFELSRQSDAAATKRDSYATRLSSQGMAAVSIDKDEEETIAGKIFRHQILSGTPAVQMARTLPRQRFHVWL
ncbi:MAG TPA: hypothetical protein VN153_12330 [Tahibacter sp.]|nr:hypothetical protein [Tahibacter sp.]